MYYRSFLWRRLRLINSPRTIKHPSQKTLRTLFRWPTGLVFGGAGILGVIIPQGITVLS